MEANKRLKVPRSTLYRHKNGINGLDLKRELTDNNERLIIFNMQNYATAGMPMTMSHLNEAINKVVKMSSPAQRFIQSKQ